MAQTSYKRPGKVNVVSIFIIVVLLAGLYSVVQFAPPYWRKWKVKEILSSSASRVFKQRRTVTEEFLTKVKRDIRNEIQAAGVKDPSVRLSIDVNVQQATISAEYRERVNHPLVGKTTTLTFRPQSTAKGRLEQ